MRDSGCVQLREKMHLFALFLIAKARTNWLTLDSRTSSAQRQVLDLNTGPEGQVSNTLPVELLDRPKSISNIRLQSLTPRVRVRQ
jgi:hypothetical protein